MEFSETSVAGAAILSPEGRVDLANADMLRDRLRGAVAQSREDASARRVIVDLARIDYISSAGLRALMIAAKFARAEGVALGIAAMQPVVREIFAISRFDLVFPCFATVEAALEELARPG